MTLRILGLLGVAAGLALSSVTALAQETAAAPAAAAPAAPAAPLKLSNKWRIEVSEGANNDGSVTFRVTPDKGTPSDVVVDIKKGRHENGVATDIRDSLRAKLDPKTYHIETDDGEDVLVKKRKGPSFELKFLESSLEGTRINVNKE